MERGVLMERRVRGGVRGGTGGWVELFLVLGSAEGGRPCRKQTPLNDYTISWHFLLLSGNFNQLKNSLVS